ncbi:citryl-CoA lyase [Muricoccus radiodurans]|uniref:citryl-CoA lyase n=1 Tax=Muricoccus radiodurans TaxID=2231721 RepID=UPI003CFB166B
MSLAPRDVRTHIATSDTTSITVRGYDLVNELMGKYSFTEVLYLLIKDRLPSREEARVLDACLVTLMEHGWTPTSLITRLAHDSAPGQVQIAIAAGLLAVGDVFAGTMEGCGRLLEGAAASSDPAAFLRQTVEAHRAAKKPMPGFGHPFHKPDDPRPPRLFRVAEECGLANRFVPLLKDLSAELDRQAGRHLTINATGAIAALLLEIGIPPVIMRGIAVVSRSGGLAGHIVEEEETRAARQIWRMAEEGIPYEPPPGAPKR